MPVMTKASVFKNEAVPEKGKIMIRYILRYWYFGLLASLFMVFEVLVDLYQPRMMAKIVDEGILGLGNGGVPSSDIIISTGIWMLAMVLAGCLCGILSGVFTNLFSQNYSNDVRKLCFRKILGFSFSQNDRFSVGSLITRTTGDITQMQNMWSQIIRGSVRCGMFFVAGSAALLSLSTDFGMVILVALPLILLEVIVVFWKTGPLFTRLQQSIDTMNTKVQESVKGLRVVKAFVQEDKESAAFAEANRRQTDIQFKVLLIIASMHPVMNIVLNLAVAAVIHLGAIRVQAGDMAPGTIMAAVTYLSQILNGMMMLVMIFQSVTRGLASEKRIREIIREEPGIKDGNLVAGDSSGRIVFHNVHFRYPDQQADVLDGIDLTVNPGETLAVIGATGSGKSSLVNLISRFYDATDGYVEVDGHDVREYTVEALRSKMAVVLQKAELFRGTVLDNIAMGNPHASREEIISAARTAQADDFIMRQPDGYDTAVVQGGQSLSGGQRQRIAIARALVKKAEILILDDSTSALDFKTESQLMNALDRDYEGVTKIIVALRIATVKNADRIAVLENGRITACDTHENLLKSCPAYIDIYTSQLKSEEQP